MLSKAKKSSIIYLHILNIFTYVNIKLYKLYLRDVGKHIGVGFYEVRGVDTSNRQAFGEKKLGPASFTSLSLRRALLLAFTDR